MKKIRLFLTLLTVFSLGACSVVRQNDKPSEDDNNESLKISLDETSIALVIGDTHTLTVKTTANLPYSFSSDNPNVATVDETGKITGVVQGDTLIRVFYTAYPNVKALCSVSVTDDSSLSNLTINTIFESHDYNTNYVSTTYGSLGVSFYRLASQARTPSNGFALLYPHSDYYNAIDENPYLPGAVYNDTIMTGLKQIVLSYSGKGIVRYGVNKMMGNTFALEDSIGHINEVTISTGNSSYFSIETTDTQLILASITLRYYYSGGKVTTAVNYAADRALPTRYLNPVEGQSATLATSSQKRGDTLYSTKLKTYHYYSSQYCIDNNLDPSSVSYTDPIDVANYYYLFNSLPPNYGASSSPGVDSSASYAPVMKVYNLSSYFGEFTRQASTYTRTSGYAASVPYGSPNLYIEFDIDLNDDYSLDTRDVGRLVTWVYGFNCYDDGVPVSVFTGDHYLTFWEYNNFGGWNHYFDGNTADTVRSGYAFSKATNCNYAL